MRIIFEFAGGSRDGQTDVGNSDDPPNIDKMASMNYFITNQGTVGNRFLIGTPYAIQNLLASGQTRGGTAEKYEVTERLDAPETGEVLIRCKFVGYA